MWPAALTLPRTQTLPIGLHLTPGLATLIQFKGRGGRLEVHALTQAPLTVDETATPATQDRDLAAVLAGLVQDHGFRGRRVVTCLGGQHLFIQNLRLPFLPPDETDRQIRMEIEERLPYPVSDAEIRYVVAGETRQDGDRKQEILLLACHRGVLQRHIQVLEQAGLALQAVDIEPLAMLRALPPEAGTPARRVFLILGERTTAVVMADGPQLQFLKYLTTGTQHLDQAVARHLVLAPAVAAQTRTLVTSSPAIDPYNDVHRAVMDATQSPMDALCAEIELCLRYYQVTFRGSPLEAVTLAGPDATGWMADYLQRRLGLLAGLADPFLSRAPAPSAARGLPASWAVACGLSLKRWDLAAGARPAPLDPGA